MNFRELPLDVREVICYARTIGSLLSSSTDGQWMNKRQELAAGLAAMHIAQAMRVSLYMCTNSNTYIQTYSSTKLGWGDICLE